MERALTQVSTCKGRPTERSRAEELVEEGPVLEVGQVEEDGAFRDAFKCPQKAPASDRLPRTHAFILRRGGFTSNSWGSTKCLLHFDYACVGSSHLTPQGTVEGACLRARLCAIRFRSAVRTPVQGFSNSRRP